MNITEELVNKLGLMGYSWKVSTILKYFLDENFKDMFGSSTIGSNDIDFTSTSNAIELESIFSDDRHVISANYDQANNLATLKCEKIVDGKSFEVFKITESPLSIENEFTSEDGIKKKFTYDKIRVCFDLKISHTSCNEEHIDYKASLSPVNSKEKGLDWFSYEREYPPKEKSFIKRITDELSGRGDMRKIVTSKDFMINLDEFPDNIFGNLLSDARVVLAANKPDEKKRIRF